MNLGGHDIGVCSWSLHPKDLGDLLAQVKEAALSHIQLGLLPPLTVLDAQKKAEQYAQLKSAGVSLTGGMICFAGEDYATIAKIRETGGFLPDAEWPQRRKLIEQAAQIGKDLGVPNIMAHAGFVPHKSEDATGYQKMVDRVRDVADIFAKSGVGLNLETGQEPAAELLQFFHDVNRPNVGINFDPANMILYGAGDPIAAIRTLGQFIRHVHVKDATASSKPGEEWGAEVPFGTGQVGAKSFVEALHAVGYKGPLCIEREAGNQRLADVKTAVAELKRVLA